jgi:hypothetical protein
MLPTKNSRTWGYFCLLSVSLFVNMQAMLTRIFIGTLLFWGCAIHRAVYAQDSPSPRVHTAKPINHTGDGEKQRRPQKQSSEKEEEAANETVTVRRKDRIFPFVANRIDGQYDLNLNLRDSAVVKKYQLLFEKNRLPFTSDIWEEILTQMLESLAEPYLAQMLIFRAGDDVLQIGTGNAAYRANFIETVYPVLNNLSRFDQFLIRWRKGRLPDE